MRPDDETNNAFLYCLIVAAVRYGIDIIISYAASNHHHTVIYDRNGTCPAFVEHFHKLVARSQNALRGCWENMWAATEPGIVQLLDRATVIDKIVYAASNPVKDLLVDQVHHWPGVNTYRNFLSGRPITATRPRHFFRPLGPMPAEVSLTMTIPPELGPAEDVIAEVRDGVEAVEQKMAEHRLLTGARVIGRKAILAQHWRSAPANVAPRRNLRPRFAGRVTERVAALLGYRAFLDKYRAARERWLQHREAIFPAGTYWLSRCAVISIEQS